MDTKLSPINSWESTNLKGLPSMTANIRNRKNRRQADIVADILRVCCEGDAKTHIMYKAGLSYPLLKKYLSLLMDKRLILQDGDQYRITEMGQNYLEIYGEIGKTQTILQQREEDMQKLFCSPTAVPKDEFYRGITARPKE
ncbi:MAG: hypothetical protein A3K61_01920 [Thaumarchaeota archaeon RBG_16_49_8]|nr:MAG: hypothetical protein A3K61_01920 [Thaumarchaeota archaeon RBG_16_49_8]